MEEYFLKKLERLPRHELQRMVDNPADYQEAAVRAASKVLGETEPPVMEQSPGVPYIDDEEEERNPYHSSFYIQPYFRSLSHRDFLSSFVLALLYLAIWQVLAFYAFPLYGLDSLLAILMFVLVVITNHAFYKIEHKRRNNYIGRVFHTAIFMVFLIILMELFEYFTFGNVEVDVSTNSPILTVIIYVIMIMMAEVALSIVRRVFKLIGWRIF
ncbi:hypothetical protein AB9P05_21820 [Roseivirga sp. BDSF3-8]|uniref:hypothetical protein n=1 Tax=Roseivirga sp. BDSF3-8 TaxID=3241598 RepID=UPI003531FE11